APAARPTNIPSGHYVLDNHHSTLIARVMHMGVSLYTIRFDTLAASFDYDPAHPEATRLRASVDLASLDVGADYSKTFANEFLKADKFPVATFVSTALTPTAPGRGTMSGDLTLMGVTKPVTFDVLLVGAGHELLPLPFGQSAAGFEATTEIRRSAFGSKRLSGLVGDEVTLQIDAEFDRK
ncbi:MAG: YceI family protein, partial [Caulobacteraceae bacterium]